MMENIRESFYNKQIASHSELLKGAKANYRSYSLLRLLVFVGLIATVYYLWMTWILLPIFAVLLVTFVYLVHKSLDAKLKKEKEELFIAFNEQELAALKGDWSSFPDGSEYKTPNHPFALDMDLFGAKSVYQLMNRTALRSGSDRLAQTLAYGTKQPTLNNHAIAEFAQQVDWCQNFIVEGKVRVKELKIQRSISSLSELVFPSSIIRILKWVLPIVSISAVVLFNLDAINSTVLGFTLIGVLVIVGSYLKQTAKVIQPIAANAAEVDAMVHQLELLKSLEVKNPDVKSFVDSLLENDGALSELRSLQGIQKRMDYRGNFLVGTLLNLFAAWDFVVVDQQRAWSDKNAHRLAEWELKLAELEVWVCGAIYHFNHPKSVFATISATNELKVEELAHPFVAQSKQVSNSIQFQENEQFLIITGPNMAGKSTYLRSVGLAILSANAGFPILAKSCTLPKFELYSSMRTADDLTVESSYFHAELTRLRFIMDAIESGKKVFVILDEILKGTNSKDKEIGSAQFLSKLQKLGAHGIIATHDLSLTNLSNDSVSFRNVYFDSTIEGENLSFDYKVRDGVCQNMNASFLLKQMKLVD